MAASAFAFRRLENKAETQHQAASGGKTFPFLFRLLPSENVYRNKYRKFYNIFPLAKTRVFAAQRFVNDEK